MLNEFPEDTQVLTCACVPALRCAACAIGSLTSKQCLRRLLRARGRNTPGSNLGARTGNDSDAAATQMCRLCPAGK